MPSCYRCQSPLLETTPGGVTDIQFFSCESCYSQYAQKPGEDLHDRWLMPLTLPLYFVIYDKEPSEKVDYVAQELLRKKPEYLATLIEHIQDELDTPKQKLSQIHSYVHPDEAKLRVFLAQVKDALQK